MLLSVLSALARLGLDPWQEAAELARLPRRTATERLASLIAALPDGPPAHRDSATIAARVIALLPSRVSSNIPSRATLIGPSAATKSPVVIYVISMAVVLGALGIMASYQSRAPVDRDHAPASGTIFPQMPPASSGR